nr:SRPBCC family protein [Phenylobacterium glaciei]
MLGLAAAPAGAASLSRSVDVTGAPSAVWAKIGSFCAIQDWHPAIGSCVLDGKSPPTRTLKTKDGATFVELRTARSDAEHRYAYTFISSPLPVTGYTSTFQVVSKGQGASTIVWSGAYTPNPGKAMDANDALAGIYESGLTAIKASLGG